MYMRSLPFSIFAFRLTLLIAVCLIPKFNASAQSGSFRSFTNDTGISIVDESAANPYPSSIVVSGLTGVITRVEVTLHNLNHSYPDDIDMLLVAPGGRKTLLMSDAGGTFPVFDATIIFDDTAPPIPNSTEIISGTYAPANWGFGDNDSFPNPAPVGPYVATLGTLNGIAPNGTWSLYIHDDIPENDGNVADGWSLSISTAQTSPTLSIVRSGATAMISWPETSPGYTLEARNSLVVAPSWATVTNAVIVTNGQFQASVPLTGTQRFFRLRK